MNDSSFKMHFFTIFMNFKNKIMSNMRKHLFILILFLAKNTVELGNKLVYLTNTLFSHR